MQSYLLAVRFPMANDSCFQTNVAKDKQSIQLDEQFGKTRPGTKSNQFYMRKFNI